MQPNLHAILEEAPVTYGAYNEQLLTGQSLLHS